ncbi:protein SSUH2 homolog [Polypterus senegalus]|uniref:protein SSUH2 homolog n=1 Tax=Polypterus senegalus TaxID=55291 RepID=UPI001963D35F|nr:protein SSUH2 homolog [Polypterus senegalus]
MDTERLLGRESNAEEDSGYICGAGAHVVNAEMSASDVHGKGAPSAPPLSLMDVIPGYESTGTFDDLPPPQPGFGVPGQNPNPPVPHWNIPSISEDVAKEVFIDYASSKCCYGTRPAKELVFTDLQPYNTFRYRLETFTESRSTEWAYEPYRGQIADAFGAPSPSPWTIVVQVPELFKDNKTDVRVPHTSSVKGCHTCLQLGRTACRECINTGRRCCWVCNGSRVTSSNSRCTHCNGTGHVCCSACSGHGFKTCNTCAGKGQLLCYIKLKVRWKNNVFEFVADKQSGLPVKQITNATGEKIYIDVHNIVYPVVGFPDDSINQASEKALRDHQVLFAPTCRILQQRQTIELIPVTRVHYRWKEKTYIYFVFGAEHQVYSEDYPAKCCCCVIL